MVMTQKEKEATAVHEAGHAIISKAQSVSDLLEVGILLKESGSLGARDGKPQLGISIVPLFETISDLRACVGIMRQAFALPLYRQWLESQGGLQEIMSSKERTLSVVVAVVDETPRLFEKLGGAEALHAIERCMKRMLRGIDGFHGCVVRSRRR